MNKKWLAVLILILLASFCFTGKADNGDGLKVNGEVPDYLSLTSFPAGAAPADDSALSANRTITLKKPTFHEMKQFILEDPTHRRPFVLYEYECRHFATDMVNNAVNKGLMAGFTLICYNDGQHAVVAFDTVDRGIIYIEPQTNAAIDIKAGGTYQDRKIKEILIAW